MTANTHIMDVRPTMAASDTPVEDHYTRQMAAALNASAQSLCTTNVRACVCGAEAPSVVVTLPSGEVTNMLAVHYVAMHRREVSEEQLRQVAALGYGEARAAMRQLYGQQAVSYQGNATLLPRAGW